jgi:NADH-quinone oxidoreductase subunit L
MLKILGLIAILAPLLGCLIAGIGGKKIGRAGAHSATIFFMTVCFVATLIIAKLVLWDNQSFNGVIYEWGSSGNIQFNAGFLLDRLSAIMMVIVAFVSLCVHVYSIGYMEKDPGYPRFFSYMSLFTFSMLVLVSANNFLQLFFGWEGVGFVSYLLIGFWFKKESASKGALKAFLVNRIGDVGFILALAAILDYFGTLDYNAVFSQAHTLLGVTISPLPDVHWSLLTVICVLLFWGAMAKSAQVPLHVWLPESMEGPTPISALIHAATMVTAGVFLVARTSPLFELSTTALSWVLIIGATGGLFLGLLAFVENDIKRVIAYSTMSQLGYMMAANGASAFSAGIFHLLTHACFKALLFLAAGSVIIAMHHEQNLWKMGNLKKYLPVTYVCFLIGALSLAAIPPFSGFYSKDAVIESVHLSSIPGAEYAYYCLLFGSFVTAYYIFRAFFLAFHTQEKFAEPLRVHIKEHWVMLVPLIVLAIPSVILGGILVGPMLFQKPGLLGASIFVLPQNDVLAQIATTFQGAWHEAAQAVLHLPFWFALIGILLAWFNCCVMPAIPAFLQKRFSIPFYILKEKYGFDQLNDLIFVRGGKALSNFLFHYTDVKILDNTIVNGSGRGVTAFSKWTRKLQTGYLYHYVFVMIIGLLGFLAWMFFF